MKVPVLNLDHLTRQRLQKIGHIGIEHQTRVYLVGGVVRDLFLGIENMDRDLLVEGDALMIARQWAISQGGKVTVYEKFKTATVVLPDKTVWDFATTRQESYPHPGALPVVKPGTISADLLRRDFTINAMAMRIDPDHAGDLVDLYGGLKDLKAKKIRVLHTKSFVDDPTRILRCLRLSARLGFVIEPLTKKLLNEALNRRVWETVKPARYFAEFYKMLLEPQPGKCLLALKKVKGLEFISCGFSMDEKIFKQIDEKILSLKKQKFYADHDWGRVCLLGLLFLQSAKTQKELARKFHLTRQETESLRELGTVKDIEAALKEKSLAPSQVYEILDPVDLEILYFIRALTSVKIVAFRVDQFLRIWRCQKLNITGTDLQQIGMMPGKGMGVVLRALLLQKIDGKIRSVAEEIVKAREIYQAYLKGEYKTV